MKVRRFQELSLSKRFIHPINYRHMKKTIQLILFCVMLTMVNSIFAQGIVGLPEFRVLYKNYDNLIQIGGESSENFQIKCEGGTLTRKENDIYLVRVVGNVKTIRIMVSRDAGDTSEFFFKVKSLPLPEISISNKEILRDQKDVICQLFVGYPNDYIVPINARIDHYSVSFPGSNVKPIKGTGSVLSNLALNQIRQLKPNSEVLIECSYEMNGQFHNSSKVFIL